MIDAPPRIPKPLQLIIDHPDAPTGDTIEVDICDVPLPTSDPMYGDLPLRLTLDPAVVARQMETGVRPYFEALSHGQYHPQFVAGTVLTMTGTESHDECVDRALDASSPDATVVMVVATAEDIATESGGWGRPGSPCAQPPCPAATTRRAMYVGSSDFYGADAPGHLSSAPLLDLIEHEIGHTLDLPHSGFLGVQYTSPLDVMSNNAAPRDTQPDRINAQDTLGINRLALGWMPSSAVAVAEPAGGSFELSPSTAADGVRLLVLPIDGSQFLTVEFLTATGFDDALAHPGGVAMHLIDQGATVCGHPSAAGVCSGVDRRQTLIATEAEHLDLIAAAGASNSYGTATTGWTIVLRDDITVASRTAEVEVHPTDG
jgi:hypothetical protein